MKKNFLLGMGITNASKQEILEYILKNLEKHNEKYYVVTPNPEILVHANRHGSFKNVLNHARITLCDGVGLFWAGKILGKPFKERVTGVDLMEDLCEKISDQPITVGFIGGKGDVAERASECLVKKYPGLRVTFAFSGNPDEKTVERIKNEQEVKKQASTTQKTPKTTSDGIKEHQLIDILFVAFGFPKQEEWVARYLDKLPVKVAICVGGALDYISGKVVRAPGWVRSLGFEWLFRLIVQPWRLKRQVSLFTFIFFVFREKFSSG